MTERDLVDTPPQNIPALPALVKRQAHTRGMDRLVRMVTPKLRLEINAILAKHEIDIDKLKRG